ncbi:MAG: hypothetical protein AAGI07_03040 [Bacteroidota bacterium]
MYRIFLFILIIFFSCADSENGFVKKEQVFIKFFGGLDNDAGAKVIELKGQGYLILGTSTESIVVGSNVQPSSIMIILTNYEGVTIWETEIRGIDGDYKAGSFILTDQQEIFVSGTVPETTSGIRTDLFMAKLNTNGDILWQKKIENPTFSESAVEMIETNDNGLVIIGNTFLPNGNEINTSTQDFYVVKTDKEGDIVWQRTYGFEEEKADYGNAVVEADNGDFIWLGTTEKNNLGNQGFNSDMRVVRSNNIGNLIWDYLFGSEGNDFGNKAIKYFNEYLLVGAIGSTQTQRSDVFLVKINNDGQEIWTQRYGGDADDSAFDISPTEDGGFIITGFTFSYGNGKSDIFLIKTDFEGNLQWHTAIGGQGDDIGNSVIQTSDGGYLICGSIQFENNKMICLIKTDKNGRTYSLD